MPEILITALIAALSYVLGASGMRSKMSKQIEGAVQHAYLLGYGRAINETYGTSPTVTGDATAEDVTFQPEANNGIGGYV